MNRKQKGVVWVWLVLLAACTLFPPWVRVSMPIGDGEYLDQVYVGRSFLFLPPDLSESVGFRKSKRWDDLDEESQKRMWATWNRESRAYHVVEVGRLLASWALVSLVCFSIVFALWRPHERRAEPAKPTQDSEG